MVSRCGVSLIGLTLATSALGQVTLVSTAFTGSDSIYWSQFGISRTLLNSPSSGLTTRGNSFTVTTNVAAGTNGMVVFQQGDGWSGDFPDSDMILYTGKGPLTISGLNDNVVGSYVQPNFTQNDGLTMYLSAYHGSQLLGTVSEAVTTNRSPGTATFLGVASTTTITSVVYSFPVANFQPQHFAIDTVQLTPAAVPEHSEALVLALGLAGLTRRRKH